MLSTLPQSFIEARPEQIQEVVQTNLLGCLLCTRAAMRLMAAQPLGGHIFNMDGAGADGLPTPQYAAYGATKAGALQPPKSPAMCRSPIPCLGSWHGPLQDRMMLKYRERFGSC